MATIKKLQIGEDTISVEGFITNTVNNLVNYYTKSEVDALVTGLSFEIVDELPTEDIRSNVIYLLRRQSPEQQNVYDEYIYLNGHWENIGSTSVDLTNYYTKTEANALLDEKVDSVAGKGLSTNDYTTVDKTKLASFPDDLPELVEDNADAIEALGSGKVDKIAGKGLSTNDYTTEDKTKLAGISSGAEANVQSDWSETDTSSDAYIANKPSTITVTTLDVDDTEKEFEIYGEEQ